MRTRAELIAYAEFVWDDKAKAESWLRSPHGMLGGALPFEHMETERGIRDVEKLLRNLFFGLPS